MKNKVLRTEKCEIRRDKNMAEVYCDFRLDANTDKEFEIIKEILEHKILNQKYVFYSVDEYDSENRSIIFDEASGGLENTVLSLVAEINSYIDELAELQESEADKEIFRNFHYEVYATILDCYCGLSHDVIIERNNGKVTMQEEEEVSSYDIYFSNEDEAKDEYEFVCSRVRQISGPDPYIMPLEELMKRKGDTIYIRYEGMTDKSPGWDDPVELIFNKN